MTATYITTTIPYVNARPHIGHALELVQADVLARYHRGRGDAVRFQAGTDDNALKNVLAAGAAGLGVREFVDRNAEAFGALGGALSLSVDDFIRTSRDPRHRPGVEAFWRACSADLYRQRYAGLYCTGCEQFYVPAELRDGRRCPEHGTEPERVSEENWFFRLSRYAAPLREAITTGRLRIEPAGRRNEVLGLIDGGLPDFSVSRPAGRAGGWGIPVPGDPDQVVYVWFDALCNYVTALGYGQGGLAHGEAYRRWWAGPGNRVHLLGKGVLRFHAVYWPAMLLASGQQLPTGIFVHDYLTADGKKISKSGAGATAGGAGALEPAALAAEYGADAVRWWLLREVPRVGDADFTAARLVARADDELANGLGNLVNRVVAMIARYRDGQLPSGPGRPAAPGGERLAAACRQVGDAVGAALENFDFRQATAAVWSIVDEANGFVNRARPWELARTGPGGDPRLLDAVLFQLLGACSVLGRELTPFLPGTAARVTAQCTPGADGRLPGPRPVFRRLAQRARSVPAAGLDAEKPQQEQQHEGTDDRPDDPDQVEAVNAQRVVLDEVLQETPDEGAEDAEHDGAEDPDGIPAGQEQPSDRAGDEADDYQHDDESNHAGKLPRTRILCALSQMVMKLADQLALQRGAESRGDQGLRVPLVRPDPVAQALRLGGDGRGGLRPGVLEQPDRDLAVLAVRPAADDTAVPPGRGADVPGPVEQRGGVLADVPGPVAPAHRGGVQGGQQRRPRPGGRRRVLVGRQHDARSAVQVDVGGLQLVQRLPDLPGRPAGPPLQVSPRGGAEPVQPAAGQLGPGGGGRRPGLVRRDDPGELAGGPPSARAAAHDESLGRQQREQPGGDVHRAAVALVRGVDDLGAQPRLVLGELAAGGAAAGGQRLHRGLADLLEPVRPVRGDAGLLHPPGQVPPHPLGDLVGTGRLDHRHQGSGHHEHRPPHPEHPYQGAFGVQRVLDVRVAGPGASPGRQVDRRRVGAVQPDDVRYRVRDRGGPGREVMPGRQPRPPLGHADRPASAPHDYDPTQQPGTVPSDHAHLPASRYRADRPVLRRPARPPAAGRRADRGVRP
jgi:methionyl-tRNA synthetase